MKVIHDQKLQVEDQENMVKNDEELIGKHFYMPRNGKEDVDLNLYFQNDGEKHPLIINIHGGAFIAGDADTLDSQSDRISKNWNSNVVTVNYKLMKGEYTKQYAVDEIKDTVNPVVYCRCRGSDAQIPGIGEKGGGNHGNHAHKVSQGLRTG